MTLRKDNKVCKYIVQKCCFTGNRNILSLKQSILPKKMNQSITEYYHVPLKNWNEKFPLKFHVHLEVNNNIRKSSRSNVNAYPTIFVNLKSFRVKANRIDKITIIPCKSSFLKGFIQAYLPSARLGHNLIDALQL